MISLLVASFAGLVISSQTAPVDDQIYVIQRKDGPVVYGYIRRDKDGMLEVESDSASDKGKRLYIAVGNVVSSEVEPRSRREARLEEQREQEQHRLKGLGLTTIAGRQIPEEEVTYARRAKEMALAREESRKTPSGPAAPAQVDGATVHVDAPSAEARGFLRQWGRHILVGVAGLALAAVIIKTLLL